MRINNNISALNAYNNLQRTDSAMSKNLERLSSGLRINRAADDAAGLAISEKMRGQVKGLNQAVRNAQDGISMIQTAEGALNETHSILQRMRELSVQSANDTNTAQDRSNLQKEVDELSKEITRIGNDTQYNTKGLVDGTLTASFQIGANSGQKLDLSVSDMRASALGVTGTAYTATDVTGVAGLQVRSTTGEATSITYTAASTDVNGAEIAETTASFDSGTGAITVTLAQAAGDTSVAGALTATHADIQSALESVAAEAGIEVSTSATTGTTVAAAVPGNTTVSTAVDAAASELKGINISSQTAADAALTTLDTAIEAVSTQRSNLGAMQNRLEHTINNLGTSAENLTAAESRIRDLDMAAEMSQFTKNQILIQAGTSMMAQANQKPQSVLSLLG